MPKRYNRLFSADRKREKQKQLERMRIKREKEKTKRKAGRNPRKYEYGIKRDGTYGRLNAADRGYNDFMSGKFTNGKSVPTSKDIRNLKEFIKSQMPEFKQRVQTLKEHFGRNINASPAFWELEQSGGENIDLAMDDYSDLIGEFFRIHKFMNDRTSTPQGVDEYYHEFDDGLSQFDIDESVEEVARKLSDELEDFVETDTTPEELEETIKDVQKSVDAWDKMQDDGKHGEEIAKDKDKWTILHRIKSMYPEIGANNTIASEILRKIEQIMSESKYSIDDITMMIIRDVEAERETFRQRTAQRMKYF